MSTIGNTIAGRTLSILYRGPLSSCNYGCQYCPFAKRKESREEHEVDRRALERFVSWVGGRTADRLSILFTPWGEALIHRRYQQALQKLTNMPNVDKAAIQTNLACKLDWVHDCDKRKLGLWATYHPGEVSRSRFLDQCKLLLAEQVRFSVGTVGLKEHQGEIRALRDELPSSVYLWVNAYKRLPDYYSQDQLQELTMVDPLFPINNQYHESLGKACHAGSSVISVNGDGDITRCHFIKTHMGNIYESGFERSLTNMPCTNNTCGCHIGYVHMNDLGLYDVFQDGILERIPNRTSLDHVQKCNHIPGQDEHCANDK